MVRLQIERPRGQVATGAGSAVASARRTAQRVREVSREAAAGAIRTGSNADGRLVLRASWSDAAASAGCRPGAASVERLVECHPGGMVLRRTVATRITGVDPDAAAAPVAAARAPDPGGVLHGTVVGVARGAVPA